MTKLLNYLKSNHREIFFSIFFGIIGVFLLWIVIQNNPTENTPQINFLALAGAFHFSLALGGWLYRRTVEKIDSSFSGSIILSALLAIITLNKYTLNFLPVTFSLAFYIILAIIGAHIGLRFWEIIKKLPKFLKQFYIRYSSKNKRG